MGEADVKNQSPARRGDGAFSKEKAPLSPRFRGVSSLLGVPGRVIAALSLVLVFSLGCPLIALAADGGYMTAVITSETADAPQRLDSPSDESFRINVAGMTIGQAKSKWQDVRAESACYDWRCSYVVRTGTNDALYICPHASIPVTDVPETQARYEGAIEGIVDAAMPLSDTGKVTYYHDWLASNVAFDTAFQPNDAVQWSTTPASAVLDGSAVCSGYARAFADMCRASDIPCEVVVSTDGEHAWNKVQIGDAWYNVDATLDDAQQSSNGRVMAMSDLRYFQLTGYAAQTGARCETDGSLILGSGSYPVLSAASYGCERPLCR